MTPATCRSSSGCPQSCSPRRWVIACSSRASPPMQASPNPTMSTRRPPNWQPQHRGSHRRHLRSDEGAVRAIHGRSLQGARQHRPTRLYRRSARSHRPLHLLAGACLARRGDARAGHTRGSDPDHRRARPRRVDDATRGSAHQRLLQRRFARRAPSPWADSSAPARVSRPRRTRRSPGYRTIFSPHTGRPKSSTCRRGRREQG